MANEIEVLAARIDEERDVGALRIGIADLTSRLIRERRDNLAIGKSTGLRRCLPLSRGMSEAGIGTQPPGFACLLWHSIRH
jgi:hypothetical protein